MPDLLKVAFATAGMYLVVILLMRLSGKKELAQLSVFDFVFILLISEAVQNAMMQGKENIESGIVAAFTLFAVSRSLDYFLFKSKRFYKIMEGTPTLLYHKGKWINKNLTASRVRKDSVESAIRQEGYESTEKVKSVILENDGNFSIIPLEEK